MPIIFAQMIMMCTVVLNGQICTQMTAVGDEAFNAAHRAKGYAILGEEKPGQCAEPKELAEKLAVPFCDFAWHKQQNP